jgi:hypothetical protein
MPKYEVSVQRIGGSFSRNPRRELLYVLKRESVHFLFDYIPHFPGIRGTKSRLRLNWREKYIILLPILQEVGKRLMTINE